MESTIAAWRKSLQRNDDAAGRRRRRERRLGQRQGTIRDITAFVNVYCAVGAVATLGVASTSEPHADRRHVHVVV
jgi:hypothetical protein